MMSSLDTRAMLRARRPNNLAGVPEFNLKHACSYEDVIQSAASNVESRMITNPQNWHTHTANNVVIWAESKGKLLFDLFLFFA
jgi:hypothetical protein